MNTEGNNEPSIADMADTWLNLKAQIAECTADLHALERDMLPFLEQRALGQATTHAGDYAITVRRSKTYKVDTEVLAEVARHVSNDMLPIRTKVEVDAKQMRYLQLNEPHIFRKISDAFESKDAKPGFIINRIEE